MMRITIFENPKERMAALGFPAPSRPLMETFYVPGVDRIRQAIRETMAPVNGTGLPENS
jgi:hypothetical protein